MREKIRTPDTLVRSNLTLFLCVFDTFVHS
nr:MAG TPA: hypothetical protein [Inoviridae sp.]